MRKQLPAQPAVHSPQSSHSSRWRRTAAAVAAAVLLGAAAWDAHALALGRITVQSALGEPLRAEIDVPHITPQEIESLRATIAVPEVFSAAGIDYNPALAGAQVSLQRRANGSYFLSLSSRRAVAEPFLDIVLEAAWAAGRIVREYTVLLDPPKLRAPLPLPIPAQVAPAPATAAATPREAPSAASSAVPAATQATPAAPPIRAAAAPAAPAAAQRITVQPGDTAGRIAASHRPPAISLDQMLVALLRGNPGAFIEGNVNRLKAGAVLTLPTAEQAGATAPGEARQIIIAQSRDFNEFRRRLAQGLASAPAVDDTASRAASGRVQAQVQEKSPAAANPDRLTLSKGAIQGQPAPQPGAEEQIARDRAAEETAARVAELNRNIEELKRLTAAAGTATPAAPPGAEADQANTGPTIAAAPAPAAAASAADATRAAAPPAVEAASAAPPRQALPKPAPQPDDPGLLEQLTRDPLLPAAAGGVLVLLLGLGWYRLRRRRQAGQVDSSFLESRLQPDSFFGASGGQHIDTTESVNATGSSMVYSPSQLDAAGDVDPVAEADVYLAYGRDLQAEEILKEALRTSPQRVAIHTKLLEIYAKRRDVKSFEQVATEAHALTQGTGTDWAHIRRLGQDLDPGNPLYQQNGWQASAGQKHPAPAAVAEGAAGIAALDTPYLATDDGDEAVELDTPPASHLDLDLDSLHKEPTTAPPPPPASAPDRAPDSTPEPPEFLDLNLELDNNDALAWEDSPLPPPPATPPAPPPPLAESASLDLPDLDLDFSPQDTAPSAEQPSAPAPAAASIRAAEPAPAAPEGTINFDLEGFSLDLEPAPTTQPSSVPAAQDDGDDANPLVTKLALAEEFSAIGDVEGARSLAEEVLAEASGELKQRAQRFLADIG